MLKDTFKKIEFDLYSYILNSITFSVVWKYTRQRYDFSQLYIPITYVTKTFEESGKARSSR